MKKVLLVAAALLILAGSLNAAPPRGYIGLYADMGHSVCSVVNPGGFLPFNMYIWCLPGQDGMTAAEFAISYPASVIPSTVTLNPAITVSLGTLTAGTSVAFGACNYDWVWTHQQACYLTATTPGYIMIIPDPTALPPAYQYATCALGNPLEQIQILSNLAMNQACVVATQNASWGAIKSLF